MLANEVDNTSIKAVRGHSSVLSTHAHLHSGTARARSHLSCPLTLSDSNDSLGMYIGYPDG